MIRLIIYCTLFGFLVHFVTSTVNSDNAAFAIPLLIMSGILIMIRAIDMRRNEGVEW